LISPAVECPSFGFTSFISFISFKIVWCRVVCSLNVHSSSWGSRGTGSAGRRWRGALRAQARFDPSARSAHAVTETADLHWFPTRSRLPALAWRSSDTKSGSILHGPLMPSRRRLTSIGSRHVVGFRTVCSSRSSFIAGSHRHEVGNDAYQSFWCRSSYGFLDRRLAVGSVSIAPRRAASSDNDAPFNGMVGQLLPPCSFNR
jgi:hypothetical protein